LQAWDFVHLLDVFDCRVQIGGSDQWGNITAGIDLARRLRSTEVFGLTCPLLTKSDGTKMGKTSSGAIWLDPKRTSPYRFYQYWINLDDADAAICLRRLTELSIEEIESLDELGIKEPEKRASQRRLAEVLTELVHGSNGFDSAKQATEIFFGGKIGSVDDETLGEIFADVPSKEYSRSVLDGDGLPLIEAIEATGLAASRSVARRAIEQGGIYVNNVRVTEVSHRLSPNDLAGQKTMVLRSGKKSYSLLRFIP
jgi:tyrosyl-tRNA synthetase